jgi:hypothetical protein
VIAAAKVCESEAIRKTLSSHPFLYMQSWCKKLSAHVKLKTRELKGKRGCAVLMAYGDATNEERQPDFECSVALYFLEDLRDIAKHNLREHQAKISAAAAAAASPRPRRSSFGKLMASTQRADEAQDRAEIKSAPAGTVDRVADVEGNDAVEVRVATSKGFGGFARRTIKRGECIVAEKPLLTWEVADGETPRLASIEARVAALGTADRQVFWALHQGAEFGAKKTAYGVFRSNSFPTDDDPGGSNSTARTAASVFRLYSRLNHSCVANTHGCWNRARGEQTVHALRDIAVGEELTVDYTGGCGMTRRERRAALERDVGFWCSCDTCAQTGDALAISDERQARIGALHGEIKSAFASRSRETIELIKERLSLMAREGMLACSWDTLWAASEHCFGVDDLDGALLWAERATECARCALGSESDACAVYQQRAIQLKQMKDAQASGIGLAHQALPLGPQDQGAGTSMRLQASERPTERREGLLSKDLNVS